LAMLAPPKRHAFPSSTDFAVTAALNASCTRLGCVGGAAQAAASAASAQGLLWRWHC
jgi:hypothetical protein